MVGSEGMGISWRRNKTRKPELQRAIQRISGSPMKFYMVMNLMLVAFTFAVWPILGQEPKRLIMRQLSLR